MKRIVRKKLICLLMAIFLAAGAITVFAQGTEEPIKQSMSLTEILETGGWLMYVLGGMSVLGLAFVVYFLLVIREQQVTPTSLLDELREKLAAGRLEEALTSCAKNRSPLSVIATAALEYSKRAEDPDPAMLKEIIEGEGNRQAVVIQNQTQYLLDIAVIAPMVGLLGTVMGMLKAFNVVALDIAKAKPMLLAAGVSQALITTAAGLIVGIPAMIFYAYFRGRTSKLLSNLESASADLLTLLIHKKS